MQDHPSSRVQSWTLCNSDLKSYTWVSSVTRSHSSTKEAVKGVRGVVGDMEEIAAKFASFFLMMPPINYYCYHLHSPVSWSHQSVIKCIFIASCMLGKGFWNPEMTLITYSGWGVGWVTRCEKLSWKQQQTWAHRFCPPILQPYFVWLLCCVALSISIVCHIPYL